MIMAEQVHTPQNGHVHFGHLANGHLNGRNRHAAAGDGRQMTKVFKALSDGTRQEILRLLESNQRTVGEIVGNFHLSQPTISRHLSVLKEADLVVDQRQGQNVIYRLNDLALSASMREFFGQFRSCQSELR
jgi:DNA-binding transcriptional ArsR family regulator